LTKLAFGLARRRQRSLCGSRREPSTNIHAE
jgi:hypothetical protein